MVYAKAPNSVQQQLPPCCPFIGELAPLLSALGHEKHKAPQIRVVLLSPYLDVCGYVLLFRVSVIRSALYPHHLDFASIHSDHVCLPCNYKYLN